MSFETVLMHWEWKGITLLLMASAFYFLLRNRSARVRFFFLMCAFNCLLLIPLAEQFFIQYPSTPIQNISVASSKWMDRTFKFEIEASSLKTSSALNEQVAYSEQLIDQPISGSSKNKSFILSEMLSVWRWDLVWCVGLLCLMTRSGWQYLTLLRIRKGSEIIKDAGTHKILEETLSKLNITKKVALIKTPTLSVPATWGWLHPVIALPCHARDWSQVSLRNVLEHECAHIKRNDYTSLQIGTFIRALTWCNPMSWWFFKRLRTDMELACDEQVLDAGASPADYAQSLLNIARSASGSTLSSAVLMASKPNVQRRIEAVLEKRSLRPNKTILRWIPLVGMLLLSLLLGSQTTLPETKKQQSSLIDAPDPDFEKRLKDYFQTRYDRTKSFIAENKLDLPDDSDHLRFFQLGLNGDWREALELARQLVDTYKKSVQDPSSDEPDKAFELIHETILEHPFMECHKLLETCEGWNGDQVRYFIANTLETLPNRTILFWDEHAGGNLLSLYANQLAESKEIIGIDQNAIIDQRYYEYLRNTLGKRIHLPSDTDIESAFITYMSEAANRYHSKNLLPGESVTAHPDGRVAVQGSVAVMGVGIKLIKWMASKNGDWTFCFAGSSANPFIQDNLMNGGLVTIYLHAAKQSSDHKRLNIRFTKSKIETIFEHLAGIRPDREACLEFVQQHFLQPKAAGSPSDNIPHESVRNAWANLILSQCKAIQSLSPPITTGETQEVLDPLFLQAWTLCPQNEDVVDAYFDYLEQSNQSEWKETVSKLVHETLSRQASE